nr:MAG TPA: hypothetical protein [Caudoviricetes sp.]
MVSENINIIRNLLYLKINRQEDFVALLYNCVCLLLVKKH